MTGTTFAALVREYTRSNSSVLTDATIVLLANAEKDGFLAPKLQEAKQDNFVVPATRDLKANKREYPFPSDVISGITKVEIKFDPTGSYIPADELNINAHKVTEEESQITSYFANEKGRAFYDLRRRAIFIYSGTVIDVTDGLKLFYSVFPSDIDATTLTSDDDLSLEQSTIEVTVPKIFHELWARRVSMSWKQNRQKPIPLNERELKFQDDWDQMISVFKNGNTDLNLHARLPDDRRLQG